MWEHPLAHPLVGILSQLGGGQAGDLGLSSHSLPLALSPSWTPIFFRVLVSSVIGRGVLLFEMCVYVRGPQGGPSHLPL